MKGYQYNLIKHKNNLAHSLVLLWVYLCALVLVPSTVFARENLFTLANEAENVEIITMQRSASSTDDDLSGASSVVLLNDHLLKMKVGDELYLTTLSGNQYTVVFDRMDMTPRSTSWIGHIKQGSSSFYRVLITFDGQQIVGSMNTPEGKMQLKTINGKMVLIDNKLGGLKNVSLENDMMIAPANTVATLQRRSSSNRAAANEPSYDNGKVIVDVLVLYSEEFPTYFPSPNAKIDSLVLIANQAYEDSRVNMKIRVVGIEPVGSSYRYSVKNGTVLEAMSKDRGIENLRSQLGADLVIMVRPFYKPSGCGLAWLNNGKNPNGTSAFLEYLTHGVVGVGEDIGGSGYNCSDSAFAHELGHNMGLNHDATTRQSQSDTDQGMHSFSFGYYQQGIFGTIMSYAPSDEELHVFSNPDILCSQNDIPCGTQNENSARSLRLSAEAISSIRNSKTTTPTPQPSNNASIFDGAGSIISPTEGCFYGCDRDIAAMQPHSGNLSTVVFQWRAVSGCSTLGVYIDPNNPSNVSSIPVTISTKPWYASSIQKSYQTTLSTDNFFILNSLDEWTTFSVTSSSPLSDSVWIGAICADGHGSITSQELNPNDVRVDAGARWMGTGSIISTVRQGESSGYGASKDVSIGSDKNSALTSFQWRVSSSCSSLRVGDGLNANARVSVKSWRDTSFNQVCSTLPCNLEADSDDIENERYYVLKIESNAATFPFETNLPGGRIEASCQ